MDGVSVRLLNNFVGLFSHKVSPQMCEFAVAKLECKSGLVDKRCEDEFSILLVGLYLSMMGKWVHRHLKHWLASSLYCHGWMQEGQGAGDV